MESCECRYCGVTYPRKSYSPLSVCAPCASARASYRAHAESAGEEGRKMYLSQWFPERYAPEVIYGQPNMVRAVFEELHGDAFRELSKVRFRQ